MLKFHLHVFAEVKNEWSCTSLGVDRDNFSITTAL